MALKIYGIALSRAGRTLWMAEELGLRYEHVKTTFTGGTRTPEYLKINPNGHIPAIDEDGFTLWESMAINLYLAKKHGAGRLYPTGLQDEARAWQWSFWGMTEVERPAMTALFNRVVLAEDKRDPLAAEPPRRRWRRRSRCSTASSVLGAICSAASSRSPTSMSPPSFETRTMRASILIRSRMPQPGCAPASPVRRRKRRSSCSRIRRFRPPRPRRPVSPWQAAWAGGRL